MKNQGIKLVFEYRQYENAMDNEIIKTALCNSSENSVKGDAVPKYGTVYRLEEKQFREIEFFLYFTGFVVSSKLDSIS